MVAEMNSVFERFTANAVAEQKRQEATGDTEVDPAHVARQKELMARIIRRASRHTGKTMDRDQFAQARQRAVGRAAKEDLLDADYVGELLKGAEDRAWLSCGECGKNRSDMKVCGGCREVRYCDKDCQRSHWAVHRKKCRGQN
jgi:hypothetical protein